MTHKDDHNSSDGYFLGGRKLTGGIIAGSLLLTNLSTEQLVGLNGAAFIDGLSVMAWEVIAALALVLMALWFLPRFIRSGVTTVPEYLEYRFDGQVRLMVTIVFLVAYATLLLPIILYTGATALIGVLDLGGLLKIDSAPVVLSLTVAFVGLVGACYAIFGGLRTVAISDTINGFGLLIGGIGITVLALYAVNQEGIFAALADLKAYHPEKFNSLGSEDQSVPFSTLFTGVLLLNVFYWCTNQQIVQRTFAASSLAEGQKGVLLAGALKVFAPLILVLPGIIAFQLYGHTDIRPDQAYGTLVRDVLPAPLTGFFAAVLMGAILSSYNSALNSSCTLFSLGIIKPFRPSASDVDIIRTGKRFGWIVAIASMIGAPLLATQQSIFVYLQQMIGLYFIPVLAVIIMGMVDPYMPARAAKFALLVGLVVIALGYFEPHTVSWLAELHEFHFLGAVFAGLILIMLIIRKMAPRETAWVPLNTAPVDTRPWVYAKPAGIALALVVLVIYLGFADLSVLT